METTSRPAVRIVCLDSADRVLLLHWRDPHDGSWLWEPPGGGIDPGETPFETAQRELLEETGLVATSMFDAAITVHRDIIWNGKHIVGPEQLFLARFDTEEPVVNKDGLMPDEVPNLHGHRWVTVPELETLPGRLEPPELAAVIAALTSPPLPMS